MTPGRRAQLLLMVAAGVPALVVALIVALISPAAAAVALIVVFAACWAWLSRAGERIVLRSLSGRPANERRDARLLNLIDGLCGSAGVRRPEVMVTDDSGLNLLVVGRDPKRATLAVTRGLVEGLSRIELEGVLADGLVQIRRSDLAAATETVVLGARAWRWVAAGRPRDVEIDLAGAALTRYPPALASALETMGRRGTAVRAVRPAVAHLWLADPFATAASAAGAVQARRPGDADGARVPIAERASALRQL